MKNKKKKWSAPLLTVLVKGRPEEMVLAACKWDTPDLGPVFQILSARS